MGRVLVGTASWTDRSLLESGWYPSTATTPEERLDHYAAKFPLAEVDATYYHPPALRTAELWRDRIPGTRRLYRRARPRPRRQPRRHTDRPRRSPSQPARPGHLPEKPRAVIVI
ncbi:DUF72 domain-containing protein [Nonomuraea wenchangensis]